MASERNEAVRVPVSWFDIIRYWKVCPACWRSLEFHFISDPDMSRPLIIGDCEPCGQDYHIEVDMTGWLGGNWSDDGGPDDAE